MSSSGHLVLAQELFGYKPEGILLEVALHVATLLAVLIYYRRRLFDVARAGVGTGGWPRFAGLIIVASVPAAVVGLFFDGYIKGLFESPVLVGFALLFTAAVLASSVFARSRGVTCASLGFGAAFLIGAAQAVAIAPGVSRSGMTIVAALWLGTVAEEAAAFSFILSVPAILGAGIMTAKDITTVDIPLGPLAVGFGAALVAGVFAIYVVIKMLSARKFPYFAVYCCIIGAVVIATYLV
ncbi:MAG: undecaprenyl-diphosphate phosphatase [Candidatus Coatesbacteria bacterium]|nr:MAG: undecaprenyl-diphosphate phosphatase [Candidatus Coatesbacteria bacterium]